MTATPARSRMTRRGSILAAAGAVAGLAAATTAATGTAADPAPGARGIHLIGDSWAAGLHADPANALGQVAARAIGWPITVDAISGTGYLNDAGQRTYVQRAVGPVGHERLVVVQGGSNDDDEDIAALPAAVRDTVAILVRRFPEGRLLLLGPGPDPDPVTARQRDIDAAIAGAAAQEGVPYVSMLEEDWVPTALLDAVIDSATEHPTISGQRYLGLRLAAALRLHYGAVIDG